jgi:hypothetical protein
MKKIITIFILPNEIDLYKDLIKRIQNDITKYNLKDFWIDSTLCVSEEMVNWEKNEISKQQVINWFNEINQNTPGDFSIDYKGKIKGCVDKRRESNLNKYTDAVSFTWIDADILFPEGTFYVINEAVDLFKNTNFIITPQYPKMWDSTWDILVHPEYINYSYNYMKSELYNPELYFGVKGDISVKSLPEGLFKFGGGAITTFSPNILKLFPIPDSFGSYGEEDTFIMTACSILYKKYSINQYVIDNLVFSQKNRDNIDRRKNINIINRKNEFREISLSNFTNEISLLYLNN